VLGRVLAELCDVELPAPPAPAPDRQPLPADLSRYLGTYSSVVSDTVVSQDDTGRMWLDRRPLGVLEQLDEPPYSTELVPWRGESFVPVTAEEGVCQPVAFLGDDGTGRARYLHAGRADRRSR
jgi:hypothetical protein